MPMKKGTLDNKSYIFEPILILKMLSRCAVCPLVKCKSLEGFDKAPRIHNVYSMGKSSKSYQFFYKIHMKKIRVVITPIFFKRF